VGFQVLHDFLHLKYSSSLPVVGNRLIESETLSPPGRLEQGHFDSDVTEIAAPGFAVPALT
jgi:hypothetical protein